MPAIKLQKFLGIAPKIASELLPDMAAQAAYYTKLYSGNLHPYRESPVISSVSRAGTTQTLYGLPHPDTGVIAWLSWAGDVDVITASDSSDDEQRIYYSGDGVPKVTYYERATSGSQPYPTDWYELGMPLPTATPTATESSFAASTSASYARDSGNTATIVTGAAHGLRTGNIVSVRGFTGTPADTFNATNVVATVVDTTTFTYYSPGDFQATTADTNGTIDLAGNTQTRTYVYTWYSPWQEESIASTPSDEIYLKEGQSVTVSALPSAPPAGDNYVRGIRLYRTLSSASGTQYFLLSTCWFPRTTATVARASNVSTVKLDDHHNMLVGDKFKLSGCTDATFDITGGEVTVVVDEYTFSYAQVAADVTEKADATGTCHFNVAELPGDTPRYWGDGSYDFTDDFDYLNLITALSSDDYDPPPSNLQGMAVGPNNMVIGFFDNQLCFAEPSQPHAWPIKYRQTLEHNIVGIAVVSGYTIVLTDAFPYRVQGSDPAAVNIAKIDKEYPCLSKRSIVNMGDGVMYATHGGLALWSPSTGLTLATKHLYDWDTWEDAVDASTVVGAFFEDKYFGSHSTGSFIFERNDEVGGYLVTTGQSFTASFLDEASGDLYIIPDNDLGSIAKWDDSSQPARPFEWKSKTIETPAYMNLGAARVIADYTLSTDEIAALTAYNDSVSAYNTAIWANAIQIGTINGPVDYLESGIRKHTFGEFNSTVLHGDNLVRSVRTIPTDYTINFTLWVDKQVVFTTTISSDAPFRLPTGYRHDTFEVGLSGSARVRSVHLSETMLGLREA